MEKLKLSGVKLVYKSGEMVRFIPGTNIPFKVKAYKESHIVLYILQYEDLNDTDDGYAYLPPSVL